MQKHQEKYMMTLITLQHIIPPPPPNPDPRLDPSHLIGSMVYSMGQEVIIFLYIAFILNELFLT
jgi:hypothetical protein